MRLRYLFSEHLEDELILFEWEGASVGFDGMVCVAFVPKHKQAAAIGWFKEIGGDEKRLFDACIVTDEAAAVEKFAVLRFEVISFFVKKSSWQTRFFVLY